MLYGVKNPHGGDRYGDGIALDFSANVSPLGTPKCVTEAAAAQQDRRAWRSRASRFKKTLKKAMS